MINASSAERYVIFCTCFKVWLMLLLFLMGIFQNLCFKTNNRIELSDNRNLCLTVSKNLLNKTKFPSKYKGYIHLFHYCSARPKHKAKEQKKKPKLGQKMSKHYLFFSKLIWMGKLLVEIFFYPPSPSQKKIPPSKFMFFSPI